MTGDDMTAGLDPDTARAVSILLAAEAVATSNKPRLGRRWRDPVVVVLLITSLAVLMLAWVVHEAQRSRASQIDSLQGQIAALTGTVDRNNDRIKELQVENAYLVTLVQRLCVLDPKNSACRFTSLPNSTSTPSPTAVGGEPSPTPTASSLPLPRPSASSSPRPSVTPSRSPSPSPTRTLLPSPVPVICPGRGLPCSDHVNTAQAEDREYGHQR